MAIWENFVQTTINSTVSIGASSIVIDGATSPFNTPIDPSGDIAYLVLSDDLASPTAFEIVSYTGRTGSDPYTLTGVSKGVDGTSDQAWSVGDHVIQSLTSLSKHKFDQNLDLVGVGSNNGSIIFKGTDGGGGEGIQYLDSGSSGRYSLWFPGSDEVRLSNRASNGFIQIAANTATAGAGGEVIAAKFEDDEIQLLPSGGIAAIGKSTLESWSSAWVVVELGALSSIMSNITEGAGCQINIQNNAYTDGTWKYMYGDEASAYVQTNGQHIFYTAPSGTADTAITWITACIIDNAGNVGVGEHTLEAWGSSYDALQLGGNAGFMSTAAQGASSVFCNTNNAYHDGVDWKYISTDEATLFQSNDGVHGLYVASSGTADTAITWSLGIRVNNAANVGIGKAALETWDSQYSVLQIGGNSSVMATTTEAAGGWLQYSQNAYLNASTTWKYISTDEASNYYTGAGTHVFRVAASGTADADIAWIEALRIDVAGDIGIGATNPTRSLHVQRDGAYCSLSIDTYGDAYSGSVQVRQCNGSVASPTAIADDDLLGGVYWQGSYNTTPDFANGASIEAYAEEAWSSGNVGTRLEFATVTNGSGSRSTKMVVKEDGKILVGAEASFSQVEKLQVDGNIVAEGTGGTYLITKRDYNSGAVVADHLLGSVLFTGENTSTSQASTAGALYGKVEATGGTRVKGYLTLDTSDGTNLVERIRVTSSGNVGIGIDAPVTKLHTIEDERLSYNSTANNYTQHIVERIQNITSWTTLKTLTISSLGSNYLQGMVEMRVMGVTANQGGGSRFSRWYFDVLGGTLTVGVMGTDVTNGTHVPDFRLSVSSNTVLIQVESSNGTDLLDGTADIQVFAPEALNATITYTIT